MESSRSPLQKNAQNHSQPSRQPSQATSQARTKASTASSTVRITKLHASSAIRGALCSHCMTYLPTMDGWATSWCFMVNMLDRDIFIPCWWSACVSWNSLRSSRLLGQPVGSATGHALDEERAPPDNSSSGAEAMLSCTRLLSTLPNSGASSECSSRHARYPAREKAGGFLDLRVSRLGASRAQLTHMSAHFSSKARSSLTTRR